MLRDFLSRAWAKVQRVSRIPIVRSAGTTAIVTFGTLVSIDGLATGDFSTVRPALIAAVAAGARTLVAYLDRDNPSFGRTR